MKTSTCVFALACACILAQANAVNAQTVGANINHSLAVKADGTVWAWGANWSNQLGDGTTTQRTAPVQVSSLTNIIANRRGQVALGDGERLRPLSPLRSRRSPLGKHRVSRRVNGSAMSKAGLFGSSRAVVTV